MFDSKKETKHLLNEYAEEKAIQVTKREQQRKIQMERQQNQPRNRKNRDWER